MTNAGQFDDVASSNLQQDVGLKSNKIMHATEQQRTMTSARQWWPPLLLVILCCGVALFYWQQPQQQQYDATTTMTSSLPAPAYKAQQNWSLIRQEKVNLQREKLIMQLLRSIT